jgi:PhoPQ-activated pathogenicity-related protein
MRNVFRVSIAATVAALLLADARSLPIVRGDEAIPTTLKEYAARPDAEFAWQVRAKKDSPQGRLWEVDLTSQTWQGIVWRHSLLVFEPPKVRYPQHAILFITGGSTGGRPGKDSLQMGFRLAELAHARVAMLHHVPNQPLLGNRKEDDLITETWLRYLATGDVTWVLQLPMVKSAVRAMDAVQALAKAEWNGSVAGFVVTGASKRGWTTWLTAVADERAVAVAPMVIDMLNLRPQMKYQLDTWGAYSEQIGDYTRKGLIREGDLNPREALLLQLVDPYTYRSRLTLPKLLIHGTNDPYWTVDAAKLYWDELAGEKSLHEVPNAGHGLDGGRPRALATLGSFFHHVAGGAPWPKLQWTHSDDQRDLLLRVTSSPEPKAARLWIARSPTKDFRQAKWRSEPLEASDGGFLAKVPKPQQDHVAFFGELQFDDEGTPYSLCTLVRRH